MPAVRRKLTISTFASLATRWLMPRVQAFAALFPETDLQVSTSTRLVDFAREDVDIALRFGGGHYPGLHVRPMFKPKEIVVASPALLKRGPPIKTFADLKRHTLLHDDSHRTWIRWLDAVGAKGVNPRRGIICGDRNSMLQATLEGQGVGDHFGSIRRERSAAGRLVKVFDAEVSAAFCDLRRVPAASPERSADLRDDRLAGARGAVVAGRASARAVRRARGYFLNSVSSSARALSAALGSDASFAPPNSASRSVRALPTRRRLPARTRRAAA